MPVSPQPVTRARGPLRTTALAGAAALAAGLLVAGPAGAAEPAAEPTVAAKPAEHHQQHDQQSRLTRSQRIDLRVRAAVRTAMAQRGDAYVYGAAGPNAFDCSGLVQYSYGRAGFNLPRTSSAQSGAVRRVARSDMRAGDLMFFTSGSGVYHSAIFLRWERGAAVMVHAPGSGSSVQVARAWTSSWFGGTLRPKAVGHWFHDRDGHKR